jgi:hypothetical protein
MWGRAASSVARKACDGTPTTRQLGLRDSLLEIGRRLKGWGQSDYSMFNVMFSHGAPAHLAAIVDWDTATIGETLMDLGHILARWDDEGEEPTALGSADNPDRSGLAPHMDKSRGMGRNGPWIGGKLTERPSEIFRRHVRVAPNPEDDIPWIVQNLGQDDSIVMGSNFPHAEGMAEPADFVKLLDALVEATQYRIMRSNSEALCSR